MGSHLSAVWRALNVPVAWKEGAAGSMGWVFSRCVCATCQKPGASWDGPPTGPCAATGVLFLGCLGVSGRREAAPLSALRPPSAATGHMLSLAPLPAEKWGCRCPRFRIVGK